MPALQTYVSGNGDIRQTLVVVFLRGGADGLNMVAPLADDGYYRARRASRCKSRRPSCWTSSLG